MDIQVRTSEKVCTKAKGNKVSGSSSVYPGANNHRRTPQSEFSKATYADHRLYSMKSPNDSGAPQLAKCGKVCIILKSENDEVYYLSPVPNKANRELYRRKNWKFLESLVRKLRKKIGLCQAITRPSATSNARGQAEIHTKFKRKPLDTLNKRPNKLVTRNEKVALRLPGSGAV